MPQIPQRTKQVRDKMGLLRESCFREWRGRRQMWQVGDKYEGRKQSCWDFSQEFWEEKEPYRAVVGVHEETDDWLFENQKDKSYTTVTIVNNTVLHIWKFLREFPGGSVVKNPPKQETQEMWVPSHVVIGKIPWRRKWQPTPVFLPRESNGQRSLVNYSPWGCKELDMTEELSTHMAQENSSNKFSSEEKKIMHWWWMFTRLMVISQNIHSYVESLCCTLGTNILLYINYISTLKITK